MTDKRIHNAAETILRGANIAITKGILRTIAAEAREEGIEAGRRMQILERGGHIGQGHACELCREYQRLKEKG